MKTKQEFITEFTLRALTQIQVLEASDEAYYIRTSIRIANDAWDAIQAANKPLDGNSAELVALAKEAIMLSAGSAQWITIDKSGEAWAFEFEPEVHEEGIGWSNVRTGGLAWGMCTVAPPSDFTKECYSISDILGTE